MALDETGAGGEPQRLDALARPRGGDRRILRIGPWRIGFDGLDAALAGRMEVRWGAFVEASARASDLTVAVVEADAAGWLPPLAPGEDYRLEFRGTPRRPLVVSWGFALGARDASSAEWRLALSEPCAEPAERRLENAARYLAARLATGAGGFAMHAAGVLEGGRAILLAGPSRSGKTTAVTLCRPARSLGDDFALVVPVGGRWHAPALPFDNSERIEHEPPPGLYPVGGVFRLFPSSSTRIERPPPLAAAASLLGVAAFPWALPDHADALLARVRHVAEECGFAHLYFTRDADLRGALFG